MKLLLPGLILIALSCKQQSSKVSSENKDTTVIPLKNEVGVVADPGTDPFTDTLMKLPFIIKSNRYIDSITNHQQGITFMEDRYGADLIVRAGYNGPERFEIYHTLIIDKKTGQIKVSDPVTGEDVPLEEYIRNNQ